MKLYIIFLLYNKEESNGVIFLIKLCFVKINSLLFSLSAACEAGPVLFKILDSINNKLLINFLSSIGKDLYNNEFLFLYSSIGLTYFTLKLYSINFFLFIGYLGSIYLFVLFFLFLLIYYIY